MLLQYNLKTQIIKKLEKVSITDDVWNNPAYLNKRTSDDTMSIADFIINHFSVFIIQLLKLIIILYYFTVISYKIWLALFAFMVIYILVYIGLRRRIYHKSLIYLEEANRFYSFFDDYFLRYKENKLFSLRRRMEKLSDNKFNKVFYKFVDYLKLKIKYGSREQLVTAFFQFVILLLGAFMVVEKKLSIGQYTLLNIYYNMVIVIIKYFFEFGQQYQLFKVSVIRMEELLLLENEKEGNIVFNELKRIEVSGLKIALNGIVEYKNPIYIEMTAPSLTVIIGENGTGKTTFINTLNGLIACENNVLFYNSIKGSAVDFYKMRIKNISNMIQNEVYPKTTVNEYLTSYLCIDVNSIVKHNIGKNLINKINFSSILDSNKRISDLSGGEKKLMSLLATFSKDCDVYILDEPTSELSELIKEGFYKFLFSIKKEKIIIISTHDKRIIDLSDQSIII